MRRLLIDPATYLAELARASVRGWSDFFFRPADPTSLGLIRVAAGLLGFWSMFVFGLDLHDYFGSTGWAAPDVIRSLERPLRWSFWFLVSDEWLRLVWCVCLVVFALLALGLFSRVTAVVSWIIVVSTVRRVPIALYGFDQVLSTLMLYLALSGASGQAVSLDRFLKRLRQARASAAALTRKPGGQAGRRVTPMPPGRPIATVSANLGLRLIQLHLVVIYGMAGLAKLQGPSWWDGTAIWKTMATGEFVVLDFTALAAWPLLINMMTHVSFALELLYPALVWVKIMRPLMVMGAVALHIGIAVMSPGLTEFALAMIAGNLAFVSGVWLRTIVTGSAQPALTVLYDGGCPRCRSSVALIGAADADHVVNLVDLTATDVRDVHPNLTRGACMKAMHAVSNSGRITIGYDAVRAVASHLPIFWPLAIIGYVPGVAWLGRRAYNIVAVTRSRDIACTDELCEIHSSRSRRQAFDQRSTPAQSRAVASTTDTEEAPCS